MPRTATTAGGLSTTQTVTSLQILFQSSAWWREAVHALSRGGANERSSASPDMRLIQWSFGIEPLFAKAAKLQIAACSHGGLQCGIELKVHAPWIPKWLASRWRRRPRPSSGPSGAATSALGNASEAIQLLVAPTPSPPSPLRARPQVLIIDIWIALEDAEVGVARRGEGGEGVFPSRGS